MRLKLSLIVLFFFFSAFADLPVLVRVGGTSAANFVYALFLFSSLLLVLEQQYISKKIIRINAFLFLFIVLSLISLFQVNINERGLQNFFALYLFASTIVYGNLTGCLDWFGGYRALKTGITLIDVIGISIALVNIITKGWGSDVFGARWLVGPRSLAMLALIPFSWHLADWIVSKRKSAFLVAFLWFLVMLASLSRAAIFISLLIGMIVILFFSKRPFIVKLIFVFFILIILSSAFFVFPPLYNRTFGGDFAVFGGHLSVNTAGRLSIWSTVWQSAQQNLLFGQGIGTSEVLVESVFHSIRQPHNDYLRIIHDLGVVGCTIWVLQLIYWAKILFRHVRFKASASSYQVLSLSSFLALFGFVCIMFTDNPITFPFFLLPLGLLLGTALLARPD